MAIVKKNTRADNISLIYAAAKAAVKAAEEAREYRENMKPHIGENGNWWVGDEDTLVPASTASVAIDEKLQDVPEVVETDEAGYQAMVKENTRPHIYIIQP